MPIFNKIKLMISAFLFVQILAACDQNSSTNNNHTLVKSGEEITYQTPGLSRYNPPIEMHLVRETGGNLEELLGQLPNESLEDNRWSRLYEQVLGIQIKYDWIAKGSLYQQKLGVAIASGHIPDVVRVNAQQLRELSNAGMIQDLTAIYDQYATPFTRDILSQEGIGPFEKATLEGRLMGIPEVNSSIEDAEYLWIRTDWMDRLGLESPTTIDDVLTISKAFTENDPDRNGEVDTFGLAATQYLWDPVMGLSGFMAAYDAFPNIWIEDDSGKLVYGGIQPEVKQALKVLKTMYQEGQLDSEFGFKDGNKVKNQIAAGKIGMFYGQQWASFIAGVSRNEESDAQWQAYPLVSDIGELTKVPLRFPTHQFFAVSKNFEHPEAIVKLINLHLEKNWGETSEYETYYSTPHPVWQLSPVTPYPALKNLEAYRQLEKARLTGDMSALQPEAKSIHKNIENYLLNNDGLGWGWERTYGPSGAFAVLEGYIENDQLLHERFVGAPTETMIEMKRIMDDLMHDTFINIILGRPLYEFDQFVEEWHRLGGAKMTDEVNQWYSERGQIQE
jgi:putative aldouronate transport system substrate-binding protein